VSTVATICARGGSTGLPGKNLRDLCGKPLIVHTIEQALVSDCIDHVFVSTDDQEIADIAINAGAEVPFLRPKELATKDAAKHPVILHCVDHIVRSGVPVSRIIDMDPTSPLRTEEDISNCLALLTDSVDVVFSVNEAKKNPYFNMVELDEDGFVVLSKPLPNPIVARQHAPAVYAINGSLYAWHTHSLSKSLWGGKAKIYVMPEERSIDIDSKIDFDFVEFLMKRRKKNEYNPIS